MVLVTELFSNIVSFHELIKEKDDHLPVHTEGIYLKKGIFPAFALSCIEKTGSGGGNTRLFDARKSARILEQRYPELLKTSIEYTSNSYPDQKKEHKLITDDNKFGKVLRYREGVDKKHWKNVPSDYSIEEINEIIKDILEENVLIEYKWDVGDILIVNNQITLHDRTAHKNLRRMIRVRYDDSRNCKIKI